jgi:hypothetical protein
MKKSSNGVSRLPVIYLFLATFFGYLSIRASKLTALKFYKSYAVTRVNLHWVFWLTCALAIFFLVPLIKLIFRELHNRKLLPALFDLIYWEQFREKVIRFRAALTVKLHSLGGQFLFVGIALLLATGFISNLPLLRDRELNNYLNEWVSAVLSNRGSDEKPVTVLQIPLFMDGQDQTQYLRNCLKIVHELGGIGVRAVLIDIRGLESSRSKREMELIQELDQSGIVVLGAWSFHMFPRMNHSHGIYTLPEREIQFVPSLNRIQPAGERNAGGPADVTLELLRRFSNYPPHFAPQQDGSMLSFGDYRIPTTREGWMYTRDRWGETAFWPRIYAFLRPDSDTLIYQSMRNGVTFGASLQVFRDEFKDKIVLVGRVQGSVLESFMFSKIYAAALENIIQNSVTRKIELSPLWLTALCIAISGFIAHRFRPLVSILLIFLFGVSLLIADSLLYDRANVLIEIIYPLLSIMMTMMIFPALSFVRTLGNREVPVKIEA